MYLRATASYTDGKGSDDAMAVSANAVVDDLSNRAPEFDEDASYTRTIAENVAPDTSADQNPANVGAVVMADDPNVDDNLTYALSGADMASFSISSDAGQISAKMKLDYEAKKSYMVTVTATDPSGASDSVDVTIKVTDMDEAPEIIVGGLAITGTASVSYAENGTDLVATYDLAGPNADSSGRWTTLGGADAGDFTFHQQGCSRFRRAPDYEAPADDEHGQHVHGHGESQRRHVHGHARRGGDGHRRGRYYYARHRWHPARQVRQ